MKKIVNGIEVDCTEEDLAQRAMDEQLHIQATIADKNRIILAKLLELDTKTIRALRENNRDRINQLEAEAIELRKGLIK